MPECPRLARALLVVLFCGTFAPVCAQELLVSCEVSQAGDSAAMVEFGLAEGATDGIDAFDEPLPPAAPDPALRAWLTMPSVAVPSLDAWRRDVRPFLDDGPVTAAVWTMTVEGAAADTALTFAVGFHLVDPPPYSLRLTGPDGLDRPVSANETIEVPCRSTTTTYYWELQYDGQVPTAPQSWGGLKAQMR